MNKGLFYISIIAVSLVFPAVIYSQAPAPRKTTIQQGSDHRIKPEMQDVLRKLQTLKGKPVENLTPEEARLQPTIQEAALLLMKEKNLPFGSGVTDTSGIEIPGLGGTIHARLYKPKQGKNWPILLYFHDGGFVIGDIDRYNLSAQALAATSGALVVSVEYRKGPENRFPMAHRDCFAAYQWALQSGDTWGGNPRRISVAGDGAGGNLAASVCLMARQMSMQMPLTEILIYPIASGNTQTASYLRNARAKPLNRPMMLWFFKNYLASATETGDSRINLLKADLTGLPPTTIITADIDPLHDEGEMLAQNMVKAGVPVVYRNFPGLTHGFFGLGTVIPQAKEAEALVGAQLKSGFEQ